MAIQRNAASARPRGLYPLQTKLRRQAGSESSNPPPSGSHRETRYLRCKSLLLTPELDELALIFCIYLKTAEALRDVLERSWTLMRSRK